MKWVLGIALGLAALGLLAIVAGQLGLLRGTPPSNLGLRDGRLKPPSSSPNSVSSQAEYWPDAPMREYARIAPLALRGDGAQTMSKLRRIVEGMPRAKVVQAEGDYLYAQFSTPLMKYTDDLELWFSPAEQVVHVRSASRLGRKDFGVNRARVEAIRQELAART
jgi:uncharacterized protein (DUF1499 family)